MTDTHCILKGVATPNGPRRGVAQNWTNSYFHRLSPSSYTHSPNRKRKFLDNFSRQFRASGLKGSDLTIECLYTKNLAAETIKNVGGTVLSFLRFLNNNNTTIFSLTRWDISSFVEYEQDRGLKAVSVIGRLMNVMFTVILEAETFHAILLHPRL